MSTKTSLLDSPVSKGKKDDHCVHETYEIER